MAIRNILLETDSHGLLRKPRNDKVGLRIPTACCASLGMTGEGGIGADYNFNFSFSFAVVKLCSINEINSPSPREKTWQSEAKSFINFTV